MDKKKHHPEADISKNPADTKDEEAVVKQRSGHFPKGTDTPRGSETSTRKASHGAR